MWEKAVPESGSPALNSPEPLPWACRVNSLWRGCEASLMMFLAWLTQRFYAMSWVGEEKSRWWGQVGPPHSAQEVQALLCPPHQWCGVHPQRLGAVDHLHSRGGGAPWLGWFFPKPTIISLVSSMFRIRFFFLHQSTSCSTSWRPCHGCPLWGPPLEPWRGGKNVR